jgi:hypothetical protein
MGLDRFERPSMFQIVELGLASANTGEEFAVG